MVDSVDKSLPNVDIEDKTKEVEVGVPGTEEVITTDETEITMDDQGGAEISFDPKAQALESQGHFDNLAELMGDESLGEIGTQLYDNYTEYKESRADGACLLYTSPSPRDRQKSRMPSSA